MDASKYAKIIKNVSVFKNLETNHLERLVGVSTRVKFKENELALETNQPGEEILIVLTGRLSVETADGDSLALVGAGLCVGEMAVFTNRERSATVRASIETEVLKIHKSDLFQFVEDEPKAGNILFRNVIEVLSTHMANNNLLMEFTHILDN